MDVELPLESGTGHWIWFGGRPALDLVNTRRERWRRDIETLIVPSDLAGWLVEARLAPAGSRAGEEELLAGRRLRDAIDACVDALLADGRAPNDAAAEIDRWLGRAQAIPHLVVRSDRIQLEEQRPSDPVQHALGLVALDAARMLGTDERERVRICLSNTCGVRLYDHSPAGRRRWCSMERCGNIAKARRHRRRSRT
jgi:predicted RNA-binding Zn ribbon-like protein